MKSSFRKARSRVALGLATAGLLTLAACGTGGQAPAPETSADSGGAGATRDLSYAVVIHGNPDGSFWNVVKKGAEDAGKQYGVKVEVTGDVEGANQAKLIDAALAKKPTGLVVSMANPDALQSSLANAKSQNIPFVTINSGADKSKEFGAIGHVGQTESIAGAGAGEQLKAAGGTKMLCIIHEAGNIGLEQRCSGAAQTFGGTVEKVQVDLNNPQGIQSTVKSKLLGDKSIDTILALNPDVAVAASAGAKDAGSNAKFGMFDLNTDVLNAIQDGSMLFAVDQQQYTQGYLPVVMLTLYKANLNTIGGGQPVLTGPGYVTKDNAAQVKQLATAGSR